MTEQIVAVRAQGPWSRDKYGHVVDANGDTVYFRSMAIACSGSRVAVAEKNTDLAAAAPDLLAALIAMEAEKSEYMLKNKLGDPSVEHTNKLARAAIAKATPC